MPFSLRFEQNKISMLTKTKTNKRKVDYSLMRVRNAVLR